MDEIDYEVDYPCSRCFYPKTLESFSTGNCFFRAVPDEEYFQRPKVIRALGYMGLVVRKKTPRKKKGVKF